MNKEFIPHEQALSLKELGFNERCLGFYNEDTITYTLNLRNSAERPHVTAVLFQQAFRWFREKGYYYQIEICQEKHPLKSKYSFSLYGKDFYYEYPKQYGWIDDFPRFKTYEEAELECLNKLIEIVNAAAIKSNNQQ